MRKAYDVIIIGAGVIGIINAYELAGAGKKVLVLEKHDSCSGAGGGTGSVISWYTKKPGVHLDFFMHSWERFKTLENELGDIGLNWEEGIVQLAENELEMASVRDQFDKTEIPEGFSLLVLDRQATLELEPNVHPDIYGSLFSPNTASIDLFPFIFGLRKAAAARGVEFVNEAEVFGLLRKGNRITGVRSQAGDFYAEDTVNCGGCFAGQIAAMAGFTLPIKPRRGQCLITQQMRPIVHHHILSSLYNVLKFNPEAIPNLLARERGIYFSIEQMSDGGLYLEGCREFAGFDRRPVNETLELIIQGVLQRFPCLKNTLLIRGFTGLRPYTPDGLPIIGRFAELDGFLMCAGHEGDGIALAPGTGIIVHNLLTQGKTDIIDILSLSPMRFIQ